MRHILLYQSTWPVAVVLLRTAWKLHNVVLQEVLAYIAAWPGAASDCCGVADECTCSWRATGRATSQFQNLFSDSDCRGE